MKKTDNKKLIIFAFFLKKLITDDFCKNVYPNKKKTYAIRFFAYLDFVSAPTKFGAYLCTPSKSGR